MAKGGSKIERREADSIATKLGAELKTGAHIEATVRYEGTLVASFGIRHGAKSKNGHIPGDLFLSQSQTVALARCHITRDGYFEILRRKGLLPS